MKREEPGGGPKGRWGVWKGAARARRERSRGRRAMTRLASGAGGGLGDDGGRRLRMLSRSRGPTRVARTMDVVDGVVGPAWSTAFGTWEPRLGGAGSDEGTGSRRGGRGLQELMVKRRQDGGRRDASHPASGTAGLWGMRQPSTAPMGRDPCIETRWIVNQLIG